MVSPFVHGTGPTLIESSADDITSHRPEISQEDQDVILELLCTYAYPQSKLAYFRLI